jgi:tetratricopeptide (TPR) repeat protein
MSYMALEGKADISPFDMLALLDDVLKNEICNPMSLRWSLSLLFVKGRLLESTGQLDMAMAIYGECTKIDATPFGIHIYTKITEAAYRAGLIAFSLGQIEKATEIWRVGVNLGDILLSCSLSDILLSTDCPNLFNHGDGVREYTLAWDNIARCANGMHLLRKGRDVDYVRLNDSFYTEQLEINKDLIRTRQYLAEYVMEIGGNRQTLKNRTETLERVSGELESRTEELKMTRTELVARTEELEATRGQLVDRTETLKG